MGWEEWPLIGAIISLVKRMLRKSQPIVGTGQLFTAPVTFEGPVTFIGAIYVDGLPQSRTPQVAELFNQAMACRKNRKYDDAIRLFRSALGLEPSPNEKAALLLLIGTVFIEQMRLSEAIGHFAEAERVALDANDRRGLAAVRAMQGWAALASGHLDDANNFLKNAATAAGEITHTDDEAVTIRAAIQVTSGFIGIEEYKKYAQAESLKRAERAFDTAVTLNARLYETELQMMTLIGCGLVRMLKGKLEPATKDLQAAVAISSELGYQAVEAGLYFLLADIQRTKGEDGDALCLLGKALDIFVVLQNADVIDLVKQRMAAIQEKRNREG